MPARNPSRNLIRDLTDRDSTAHMKTRRWGVYENFQQLPMLNASYAATTLDPTAAQLALIIRGNKNYEIVGVNAATADDVAYSPHGGVNITTAANDNDSTILRPQADSLMTALHETAGVNFGTEDETWFDTNVLLDNITNATFWAGLVQADAAAAATPAAVKTISDDAAFFMFSTGGAVSTTNFTAIVSIAGTDTEVDLGAPALVATATNFRLTIAIDSDRRAGFYVDGRPLWNSPALTNDEDLIPVVGVLAEGATAQDVHVRYIDVSRLLAVN